MNTIKMANQTIFSIGRRKTSTATVTLIPSTLKESSSLFEVNGKLGKDYFQSNFGYLKQIYLPLDILELNKDYQIIASVKGGGLTSQSEAIKLAIAKALSTLEKSNFRPRLKREGLLTRDARIKERRKYGLKKARKASQYSKR
uniref:Small ribosomal subunit protein uS9c n=1 Tax=Schizocladia ischiensis TaxID=196139 RepID=A0A7S6U9Y8_9STRA|nr:ribosomal protein S9 [Schizocladia ischiensis]QOW07557.1 ribosomal protein S9 [Schizocladia ischiensis]